MTTHVFHGFRTPDGGESTIGYMARFIPDAVMRDYGYVGLLGVRERNEMQVLQMLRMIKPGDVLVGYSNGALICYDLVMAGAPVAAVVTVQPALRKDTVWPDHLPVLNLYNSWDWVVEFGRLWGRLASKATGKFHGWGAAGRQGFTAGQENVIQCNVSARHWGEARARGHKQVTTPPQVKSWGPKVNAWCERNKLTSEEAQRGANAVLANTA